MTTTVVKVNGFSPNEWTEDDGNRYVGRSLFLRSGRYEGQTWPNSGFGNVFRFQDHFTKAERIECLFFYVRELSHNMNETQILRKAFYELRDKVLGCWCVNWNGLGEVPLCHAAWLARIVDLFHSSEQGVLVTPSGLIQDLSKEEPKDAGIRFVRSGKCRVHSYPWKVGQ